MDLLDLGRAELREGSAYLPDTDLMSSDFQIQGLGKLTRYHIKHYVLHQFCSVTRISLAQTLILKRAVASLEHI